MLPVEFQQELLKGTLTATKALESAFNIDMGIQNQKGISVIAAYKFVASSNSKVAANKV